MVEVGRGVLVGPPGVIEGTTEVGVLVGPPGVLEGTAVLVRVAVFVGPEVGGVMPGVFVRIEVLVGIVVEVLVGTEVLVAVATATVLVGVAPQPAPLGRPAMVTV
jgi:hypothetical protein